MKATNNYRKCPYCPHHMEKKPCCCRRSVSSRPKNKSKHPKKFQSAISQVNTTLPISVSNFQVMPSIIAENSSLRTQNDCLKRQLHTQYQTNAGSSYINSNYNYGNNGSKDSPLTQANYQGSVTTFATSQNQTSRAHYLQDKLYLSNRKLQETLLQLDVLSKANKNLNDLNTKLQLQSEQLRIQNEQLREQLNKIQKKNKKIKKNLEEVPTKAEFQKILSINQMLERQNQNLRDQIQQLRDNQFRLKNQLQNRKYDKTQNLSPEWVAHTSTKINAIQKNICRLEEENNRDDSQILFGNPMTTQNNSSLLMNHEIKLQLISAIKMLKMLGNSTKFNFSYFLDDLVCNQQTPLLTLIKSLCEAFIQPILKMHSQWQKQMERKMKIYENKFQKLVQKIHNMVIKIQNQRLRARALVKKDFYQ